MRLTHGILNATLYNEADWARELRDEVMPKGIGEIVQVDGTVVQVVLDPPPTRFQQLKALLGF